MPSKLTMILMGLALLFTTPALSKPFDKASKLRFDACETKCSQKLAVCETKMVSGLPSGRNCQGNEFSSACKDVPKRKKQTKSTCLEETAPTHRWGGYTCADASGYCSDSSYEHELSVCCSGTCSNLCNPKKWGHEQLSTWARDHNPNFWKIYADVVDRDEIDGRTMNSLTTKSGADENLFDLVDDQSFKKAHAQRVVEEFGQLLGNFSGKAVCDSKAGIGEKVAAIEADRLLCTADFKECKADCYDM